MPLYEYSLPPNKQINSSAMSSTHDTKRLLNTMWDELWGRQEVPVWMRKRVLEDRVWHCGLVLSPDTNRSVVFVSILY